MSGQAISDFHYYASDAALEEATIDDKIAEVSGMPTFSSVSQEEIEEVKASIKSEFSIKLDHGVLIEEKNHEKWFLARKAQLGIAYNAYYYKRVVAIAIIFKGTDEIIKQTDWYKEKHSYKANVTAYTMSVLFDYIRSNARGFEVDFMRIWNIQALYPELEQQLRVLCTQVYEFITRSDRPTENVTQWCKQARCWELAQKQEWNILPSFLKTLIEAEHIKNEEISAKEERKIEAEVDALKYIMGAGKEYWEQVYSWGTNRKLLSEMESSILKLVINMERTGRIPSVKQAKVVLKMREKLISEGMPRQFNS